MVATQVNGSVSYIQAHKKYNWTIAPSTLGLKGDDLIHLYDARSVLKPRFLLENPQGLNLKSLYSWSWIFDILGYLSINIQSSDQLD